MPRTAQAIHDKIKINWFMSHTQPLQKLHTNMFMIGYHNILKYLYICWHYFLNKSLLPVITFFCFDQYQNLNYLFIGRLLTKKVVSMNKWVINFSIIWSIFLKMIEYQRKANLTYHFDAILYPRLAWFSDYDCEM